MNDLLRTRLSDMQLRAKLEEMVLDDLPFTISDPTRLLKLNDERYAEEVAQGQHEKKRGAKGVKREAKSKQEEAGLFSEAD